MKLFNELDRSARVAELADALASGFCAPHLVKASHPSSSRYKVYQNVQRRSFRLALSCSLLLIVWLQISQSTFAQEKPCCSSDICRIQHHHTLPEAPKPKPDSKVFRIETAALAGSMIADAITTRQLLDRGGWENDRLFGRHPSAGKQAAINAVFFAGQVIAFHYTERSRHPLIRWLGRVAVGYQIEDYTRAAACNSQLDTRASARQGCGL